MKTKKKNSLMMLGSVAIAAVIFTAVYLAGTKTQKGSVPVPSITFQDCLQIKNSGGSQSAPGFQYCRATYPVSMGAEAVPQERCAAYRNAGSPSALIDQNKQSFAEIMARCLERESGFASQMRQKCHSQNWGGSFGAWCEGQFQE